MNPARPIAGELETEVTLPVRLEYELSPEGELEVVLVLVPQQPERTRLAFEALPLSERRSLEKLIRAEAHARAEERTRQRSVEAEDWHEPGG